MEDPSTMSLSHARLFCCQIPKSEKFMFDECPWPFTAAHDPKKFIKDGKTHIVALWALLCQLWSLFNKTRIVA